MKYMNQTEYSKHIGLSQQRVSQLIRDGYLKGALKTFGSRKLIDPAKADQLLDENLDHSRRKKSPTPAQRQAHAWAWEGAENREPIWETLRYLVRLQEISPDAVKITFPVLDDEGIIFEYKGYDLDCGVTSERLSVDILLDEDDDEDEL